MAENSEITMLAFYWNQRLLRLIDTPVTKTFYVSILENPDAGRTRNEKGGLARDLERKLKQHVGVREPRRNRCVAI